MKDIPIIFSGPMVRALLSGRKTMTRRLATSPLRKVHAGDRLWVRENHQVNASGGGRTWSAEGIFYPGSDEYVKLESPIAYVGKCTIGLSTVPSIHMPRWASRLTLIVTAVKSERLLDISEADAVAEGIAYHDHGLNRYGQKAEGWHHDPDQAALGSNFCLGSARHAFGNLWNLLHGENAWAENPELVAISFDVVKSNIDSQAARIAA